MYAGAREIRFEAPSMGRRPEPSLVRRAADDAWNLERLEREYILTVLDRTDGHQGRAADILGIDRRTLYRKLKEMRTDGRSRIAAVS
jgi:DNA-binding NtrC family response regulator